MYLGTYVSKKDSERWRILFAQVYRIFLKDFRK